MLFVIVALSVCAFSLSCCGAYLATTTSSSWGAVYSEHFAMFTSMGTYMLSRQKTLIGYCLECALFYLWILQLPMLLKNEALNEQVY
jgi:hypothetical protein